MAFLFITHKIMKKTILFLTLFLFSFNLLLSQAPAGKENGKREFRGAWIHIVGNQKIKTMTTDQVKQWFTNTLDSLQMSGCNAVIFQIRPQADAFYQSDLEPWTRFLTGTQGVAPDPYWDPLQFMIEESHNRGMELHAWCNPYRVTSNDQEQLSPDHLYFKHPEIFKRYGKQLYFDPGEPMSIEHTVKVIADIVNRYDVDAIHFDDYFYPYPERFEEFHDDESFVKYREKQGFEYWEKGDWRRNNVATLIKEINDTIKSIKPWVRFGISPFGIHRNLKDTPDGSNTNGLSNYDQLFADVPGWAVEGWIDYIVPQLYWKIGHSAACYEILINWWNESNFTDHLYVGQSISTLREPDIDNPNTTQFAKKMDMVRTLPNIHGNVWWPGWSIARNSNNIYDSLTVNYQSRPALIPAYNRLDSIAPPPVRSIQKKKNNIEWSQTKTDDKMQQALFYAVYFFPKGSEINIEDPQNLYTITNRSSIDVSEFKGKKGKVVITVLDRCWNESAPSKGIVL